MKPHVVLKKEIGETPLHVIESYKAANPTLSSLPMAYAGRLDPMASGKLLVLMGEECKVQEKYHNLDKEYIFEVIFGVGSDSGDVLGLLNFDTTHTFSDQEIRNVLRDLVGPIELPYPHFSSKTVKGKPLHTWKVEGKISEITIPTKRSTIYALSLLSTETKKAHEVYHYAAKKIETIPKVTDERKVLGNDFRRDEVRASWKEFLKTAGNQEYTVARIRCVCSSGTYMRTLAEVIAGQLGTKGLAYSIHRSRIGRFKKNIGNIGFWLRQF